MEKYSFEKDIPVICVTAKSFPAGVQQAYNQLHSLLPSRDGRTFYGISYQNAEGAIIYKAAATTLQEGEEERLESETFVIKKGDYISKTLLNWRKDETIIGKTFQELLKDPRIDKNGYCLEIYNNTTDVICMVKLGSGSD